MNPVGPPRLVSSASVANEAMTSYTSLGRDNWAKWETGRLCGISFPKCWTSLAPTECVAAAVYVIAYSELPIMAVTVPHAATYAAAVV